MPSSFINHFTNILSHSLRKNVKYNHHIITVAYNMKKGFRSQPMRGDHWLTRWRVISISLVLSPCMGVAPIFKLLCSFSVTDGIRHSQLNCTVSTFLPTFSELKPQRRFRSVPFPLVQIPEDSSHVTGITAHIRII